MRVVSSLAALIGASAIMVTAAQAQSGPGRMFQAVPPAACASPLGDTGKPIPFGDQPLSDAQRGAFVSAIFLTLHDPAGDDHWPKKEIEAAPGCPVARFTTEEVVWTINAGGAGVPLRWADAATREELFFLAKGPSLAEAEAWDRGGRRGLPAAPPSPTYYLIGRIAGLNFVAQAYDGPPSMERMADDIAALVDGDAPPLAVHDPAGDAISLFVPTESGQQAEVIRPQDITADSGVALLFFPDGRFFTDGDDGAYVMAGSGFACPTAYGDFKRDMVSIYNASTEALELSCRLEGEQRVLTITVMRSPDASGDKARWEAAIRAAEQDTGIARKLANPPTGPKSGIQAGRNWVDNDGFVQTMLYLRGGEYVYELIQANKPDDIQAANAALLAVIEQIDLPDARSAEGWRARR